MLYSPYGSSRRGALADSVNFPRVILRPLCCALLLAALALPGCLGGRDASQVTDAAPEPVFELSPEAGIAYYLLLSEEALGKGDTETALTALDKLTALAPAPELYRRRTVLLEQARQRDKALEVAREGALKYPDDYTLQILWAELLERDGQDGQALNVLGDYEKRYALLSAEGRKARLEEISEVRQFSVYLLLNGRRFDEAEAYLRAVPPGEATPTLLYYEVVLLRNQGRESLAAAKLYELVKNYPEFTDGWITLAEDMEKSGNYKSAVRFYHKALESSPVTEIYLRMLSARIKSGDVRGAQNQVVTDIYSPEVKLQAALIFMDAKEYRAARVILLTIQQDQIAGDDAALYLGMIAYDTGENVDESLERLQDISPDARNRARMIYLKALLHIRDDDYPAALEAARLLHDEYPENKEHWAFLAELANVSKNYELGESVAREALEQWPEDEALMYSLSMSLAARKKYDQAIQSLEDLLLLNPDNNMAVNALAYTLAEAGRDLTRALSLARRALSHEPENVGILDTLAWVQYRMGDYPEAWKNIKLCVADGVEDAVIWEHYGDIALAVRNKAAARTGFIRALELKPDNSADIRAKLQGIR